MITVKNLQVKDAREVSGQAVKKNNLVLRLSQIQQIGFDNEAYYEEMLPTHFWAKSRFRRIVRALQNIGFEEDDSRVNCLDVGCGNGVLTSQCNSRAAWRMDSADIIERPLADIGEKLGQRIFLYDIGDRVAAMKSKYDIVFALDVVEHCEDSAKFLEDLVYHVRPGGYIVINVPALPVLWSYYDEAQGHFKRYVKRDLIDLAEKSNLRIVECNYWGMLLVPLLIVRKFMIFILNRKSESVLKVGFKVPGKLINWILNMVSWLEEKTISKQPFGTSLLCVMRRPNKNKE